MRAIVALSGLLILLVGSVSGAQRERGARPALTKSQQTILETQIIPAQQADNAALLLNGLQAFVKKANANQIAAADEQLKDLGIPSIVQLLSAARLALIEQGQITDLSAPRGKELFLTLAGLQERIEALLNLRKTEMAFDSKAPALATFDEFAQRFWEIHVLENQLSIGQRLAEFGSSWKKAAQKASQRNLSDDDRRLLETDFDWLGAELTGMRRELAERSLELRLQRLEFSVARLAKKAPLTDRFQAAFALDLDGELLQQFYFAPPEQTEHARRDEILFRPALADAGLPTRINELLTQGRTAAGEQLIHKSRLLYTGLHWWYRGRYGMGPEGHGLLKSMAALQSADAQFGLYMPIKTPDPTADIEQGRQGTQYPRRHYQLWRFETRDLAFQYGVTNFSEYHEQANSITHFNRFY